MPASMNTEFLVMQATFYRLLHKRIAAFLGNSEPADALSPGLSMTGTTKWSSKHRHHPNGSDGPQKQEL